MKNLGLVFYNSIHKAHVHELKIFMLKLFRDEKKNLHFDSAVSVILRGFIGQRGVRPML